MQESGLMQQIYMAPLEGITGYIYRRAFHEYFGGVDKYFTPFINPNQYGHLSSREKNDILPEHNPGMRTVPQLLTNDAEDFATTVTKLAEYGYSEVNLNLGCPSKTVINKKRGSGFLAYPDELDRFLEAIFRNAEVQISIKTRIGKDSPEEFSELLRIFNQYPLKELIIHPRVQQDFYKNVPNRQVFQEALAIAKMPVCYNGDINTTEDYRELVLSCPEVAAVMLGRGVLFNPGLIGRIRGAKTLDKMVLRQFHDRIYEDYRGIMSGERNVLYKMKELWSYMGRVFTNYEKYVKKIRKAGRLPMYEDTVDALFAEQEIYLDNECRV